jgi:hypothetical protein
MKTQNDKVVYLLLYPATGRAAYLSSLRCLPRAMRLKPTRSNPGKFITKKTMTQNTET